jgi:cyclophilin family peptidyl-prolyl cis-trans isomerase
MKALVSLVAAILGFLPLAGEVVVPAQAAAASRAVIETTMGDITIALDPEQAPVTVDNFTKYVRSGFYNGTIFHRVIENFMIQGGGYTRDLNQKTPLYPPIKLEARNGLKNLRGTVAMARTRTPDSATCQFFINLADNPVLDYNETTNPVGYAVFGRVVEGMDVVDKIGKVKVVENKSDIRPDGAADQTLPAVPVLIKSIRLVVS